MWLQCDVLHGNTALCCRAPPSKHMTEVQQQHTIITALRIVAGHYSSERGRQRDWSNSKNYSFSRESVDFKRQNQLTDECLQQVI